MSGKHTPGPWEVEVTRNEDAEYGSGPDSSRGFDAYSVIDQQGRVLFDSLNRDTQASLIEVVEHELGADVWDAPALHDLTLAAAAPDLLDAAKDALCTLEIVGGYDYVLSRLRSAIAKATGAAT